MPYPTQHKLKSDALLPDEQQVYDALDRAGYACDPDGDWTLFTPLEELYQTYLTYINHLPWREIGHRPLTRAQFGVALRRVYGWDYRDGDEVASRRRVHGRRIRGVYHLKGPATVRVVDGKGRRPANHDPVVDS